MTSLMEKVSMDVDSQKVDIRYHALSLMTEIVCLLKVKNATIDNWLVLFTD